MRAETTVLCGFEICLIQKGEINHNKQQLDRFLPLIKFTIVVGYHRNTLKKKGSKNICSFNLSAVCDNLFRNWLISPDLKSYFRAWSKSPLKPWKKKHKRTLLFSINTKDWTLPFLCKRLRFCFSPFSSIFFIINHLRSSSCTVVVLLLYKLECKWRYLLCLEVKIKLGDFAVVNMFPVVDINWSYKLQLHFQQFYLPNNLYQPRSESRSHNFEV